MKKNKLYIVIDKNTGEAERMLINDWYIVPQFTMKKYATQFMKEKFSSEDLKVISVTIIA